MNYKTIGSLLRPILGKAKVSIKLYLPSENGGLELVTIDKEKNIKSELERVRNSIKRFKELALVVRTAKETKPLIIKVIDKLADFLFRYPVHVFALVWNGKVESIIPQVHRPLETAYLVVSVSKITDQAE